MLPRIALPEPTSLDTEYNSRSLPSYIACLQSAGATPVLIPLHESPDRIAKLLANTQGALLPGARYDIDPQTYGESTIAACEAPDSARAAVDELLLQDAFNLRKPLLGICYGLQSLNVWRGGSLIQDLPEQTSGAPLQVNHAPGRDVTEAHEVKVDPSTVLGRIAGSPSFWTNSSHHQAVRTAGDNLVISGECAIDGVIEALELSSTTHWVLGVQWHPERTYTTSGVSRAIFAAFVKEAAGWKPKQQSGEAVA